MAQARSRHGQLTRWDIDPLGPLIDDLIRLTHPDLHQKSPRRLAIATAITPLLLELKHDL